MWGRHIVLVATLALLHSVKGQYCEKCRCQAAEQLLYAPARPAALEHVKPLNLTRPPTVLPLSSLSLKRPAFRRLVVVKPAVLSPSNTSFRPASIADGSLLTPQAKPVLPFPSQCMTGYVESTKGIDLAKAYAQFHSGISHPAPADAVSLAIAYKQAQDHQHVDEDGLFFGFRKMPVESPCPKPTVFKTVLPEENIYAMNTPVVELQPDAASFQADSENLSGEAADDLLDLAISEEASRPQTVQRPTFTELGYGPVKVAAGNFVNVASAVAPLTTSPNPAACQDGFRAGTVEYTGTQQKLFNGRPSSSKLSPKGVKSERKAKLNSQLN